jgi:hypothetical protein
LVLDASPYVLKTVSSGVYKTAWGTIFKETGSSHSALAFVRSPKSTNIYPVVFDQSQTQTIVTALSGAGEAFALNIPLTGFGPNIGSSSFCFVGTNGQDASVDVGAQSDSIELKFDVGCS